MKKPASSGKRFLIVGLSAVGAAVVVPACGSAETSDSPSLELAAAAGAGGAAGDSGGGGSSATGSGGGGVHGVVAQSPSGCATAGRPGQGGPAAAIGLGLLGLMAGTRRRRPRSE